MGFKNWWFYKKLFNSPKTVYKKLLNSPEKVKPDFTEIVEKCTTKHQFSSKELNKFDLTDADGTLHIRCDFCSGPMYKGSRCKNCQYLCHTSCELDVQNSTTCPQNNKVKTKPIIYNP